MRQIHRRRRAMSPWHVRHVLHRIGLADFLCDRQTGLRPHHDPHRNAALSLSDIPMILAFGLLSDDVGRRKTFRSTDIAGVRFGAEATSRVPKHGPPGHTSCDGGMVRQSFR